MPPMPFQYEGRDAAASFYAPIFGSGRQFHLVPTRANGQPAFGAYVTGADGTREGAGLFVLGFDWGPDQRHDSIRARGAALVRPT